MSTFHIANSFVIPASFTSNDKLSWQDAELFCQTNYNSNLISIHSDLQYKAIVNEASQYPKMFWIGLYFNTTSSSFQWSDGSPFNFGNDISGGVYPWDYMSGTGIGAPNNIGGNEYCIRLWYEHEYYWDDVNCESEFFPICNDNTSISYSTTTTQKPTQVPLLPSLPPTFALVFEISEDIIELSHILFGGILIKR